MTSAEPADDPATLVQAGYRFALSLSHHHYDAEDLVQQASMKCHHRYGAVANRSVLYTAIRNLFYDQLRRQKIIVFESVEGQEFPPDTTVPQPGTHGDLDVLLAGLRAEEREALYLNAVEGYTAREIADQTGCPRNTILSLLHRARQKLTAAWQNESNPSQDPRHEQP